MQYDELPTIHNQRVVIDVLNGKASKRFDLSLYFCEKYFFGLIGQSKVQIRSDPEVWKYLVSFCDSVDTGKPKPKIVPKLFWQSLNTAYQL
jgi:hypothetical protein